MPNHSHGGNLGGKAVRPGDAVFEQVSGREAELFFTTLDQAASGCTPVFPVRQFADRPAHTLRG
jgi:2-methylaconitate cis-trans-isomerase PrpF